jgi:PAS domain S-box-containing protein
MSFKEKNNNGKQTSISRNKLSSAKIPEQMNNDLPLSKKHLSTENTDKNLAVELSAVEESLAFEKSEKAKLIAELAAITKRLQQEETYRLNYITAIDSSNASVEFDLDGNILRANKNFLEIMGYTEAELSGKHHSLFVEHSYAKSQTYKQFWKDLKKGMYQKDEFMRVNKNGDIVWLSGSYNPIADILGKPYKILHIATDITLAKTQFLQLEVEAREKEKRANELVIANKELAFQNKEKEKRAAELIIANKELQFQNSQKEIRAKELIIANKELAVQSREKEKRAAELITANKKLAAANILKEKRKVEKEKRAAELIVTNRELAYQEKRGEELTIANTEMKKAQEELGSFSYSVSHDLRAPIRAINGYTQILIEDHSDSIDQDGKKILQSIINNSKKMGLLIDDLLAFSKLGRKEITSTNVDMNALVKGVLNEIIIEKDQNIPIIEMEELTPASGDPSLIKQVWINLISNAIKYSKYKAETRIKITSVAEKNQITYCIKDWGAGFDMAYYDKLFGVFQRLHSQDEFSGTGIGLAIVQKIVDRHHGKVWAESKLDHGASFYFSLPNINN